MGAVGLHPVPHHRGLWAETRPKTGTFALGGLLAALGALRAEEEAEAALLPRLPGLGEPSEAAGEASAEQAAAQLPVGFLEL